MSGLHKTPSVFRVHINYLPILNTEYARKCQPIMSIEHNQLIYKGGFNVIEEKKQVLNILCLSRYYILPYLYEKVIINIGIHQVRLEYYLGIYKFNLGQY